MQIRQKYSNASLRKFVVYSLQHSETFEVSHVFLPLTIAELSTLKQVRFFGPPCRLLSDNCEEVSLSWHFLSNSSRTGVFLNTASH